MELKYATIQAFGGRRIGINMAVYTVADDSSGMLRIRGAECVEFDGDKPVFRIAETPGYPQALEFVESVDLLDRGKWTWPPRI